MSEQVIYKKGRYRILEVSCSDFDLNELKGDQLLKDEELDFERKVIEEGVYYYVLEEWNPEIDAGWEHVDSCSGFVGRHSEENHYIVDELINKMTSEI